VKTLLISVAYKYGIGASLPRVSYLTYTDKYLIGQIATVLVIAIEGLASYNLVEYDLIEETIMRTIELFILLVIVVIWIVFFVYTGKFKRRIPWSRVGTMQETRMQMTELFDE